MIDLESSFNCWGTVELNSSLIYTYATDGNHGTHTDDNYDNYMMVTDDNYSIHMMVTMVSCDGNHSIQNDVDGESDGS